MTPRSLLLLLFLSGCAAHREQIPLSVPANQAATLIVEGNPSFWEDLFWSILTLGFINHSDPSKVKIRKINGLDAYADKVAVDPGPCEVGFIFSGKDGRKSKGILVLKFEAAAGGSYGVRWDTESFDEKWFVEIQHDGVITRAEGETFVPDLGERRAY